MLGWSGEGVETPLVGVVVVGGGVVDDVFKVDEGVVDIGLELELADVVGLIEVELGVIGFDVVEAGIDEDCEEGEEVGKGSFKASTQYDLPTTTPPQSAVIDGF